MEKKVFVTGANGFIGQHSLIPLLEEGYTVYACCHHLPVVKIPDVHYITCDLRDDENIEKILCDISVSYLLHFAWYVEPKKYMHSEQNIEWLNYSMKLIQLFIKYGGKRIVTAGTCAEYDWQNIHSSLKISENFSTQNNFSLYSASKTALGSLSYAFTKKYGLSAAHGRIFYLFGPGENTNRLIPSAISLLRNKQEIKLENGLYTRDYLYVKDVANAFVKILTSDITGSVNVGYGEGQNLLTLLKRIESIMGERNLIKVSTTASISEPISIIANINKLKMLGWRRKYSIEEALKEYCDFMNCM